MEPRVFPGGDNRSRGRFSLAYNAATASQQTLHRSHTSGFGFKGLCKPSRWSIMQLQPLSAHFAEIAHSSEQTYIYRGMCCCICSRVGGNVMHLFLFHILSEEECEEYADCVGEAVAAL